MPHTVSNLKHWAATDNIVETPTLQLSFLCPYTKQHTDLVNSRLTATAKYSPSLLLCLLPQTNKTAPDKRNYILEATPISSANQPMAEQADQQWPV